jgi:membrane protein YdbS with pleckstrin-like domain
VFENVEIATDDLPKAAHVDWQPMHETFLKQRLVVAIIINSIVIAGLAGLHTILALAFRDEGISAPLYLIWLILLPVAAAVTGWPFLSVPRMGYAIRDRDILYRAGVLWRRVTAIPYNRIQHVEKDTSPLDRRYGLANLKIFTAGGASGDLKIHGLGEDTAERIRSFLLERAGAAIER